MAVKQQLSTNGKESVSILGCGWLGLPLAKCLQESGYSVKGSRRSDEGVKELEREGVSPYPVIADPSDPHLPTGFFECNILVITLPPGRKDPSGAKAYPERIRQILEHAQEKAVQRILITSSSSVYPEKNKTVTESEEERSDKGNGPVLLEAEAAVSDAFQNSSTIVRFGGLLGPGRHPVRFLSGRQSSRSGKAPVNMIHRIDAVGVLHRIITESYWGELFNACAPEHPTRSEFYSRAAGILDIAAPEFDPEASGPYKVVDPSYLIQRTEYRFQYPDPLGMPVE